MGTWYGGTSSNSALLQKPMPGGGGGGSKNPVMPNATPEKLEKLEKKMSSFGGSSRKKSTIIVVQPPQTGSEYDKESKQTKLLVSQLEASLMSAGQGESHFGEDYTFAMLDERYLEGEDTRFVEQWDDDKFVAGVWGKAELVMIDREKPDLF